MWSLYSQSEVEAENRMEGAVPKFNRGAADY